MSRLLRALALTLIASPMGIACAHDPLDDKSGEEDFVAKKDDPVDAEGKPRSARADRQEVELKKEEDEIEQVQFKFNQEKEALIADRQELKEVMAAQHQRDLVLGRKSNTSAPTPASGPTPKAAPADEPAGDSGGMTVSHKPKANKGDSGGTSK